MTFDKNALSYGDDVSHTEGSDSVTINEPGLYFVSFHGVISPTSTDTFPVNLVTSLEQDGSVVPGASIPYNFQSASDASEQAFTIPLAISTVPTTLQVTVTGGNYLADAITLNVTRLGDIPS